MNQTVVTRLMKAIEITYKEHLPQWEFPNKEIWIQEEKEQMCDFVEYCQTEHSKYQETEASWIKELTIDDLFEKRYTK
jgi:hypothetical protein